MEEKLTNAAAVKDYILTLAATLKLTQKEILSLREEAAKWKTRIELASSLGKDELRSEAEKKTLRVEERLAVLYEEELSLQREIDLKRKELPRIAASERSIDPVLLEQEIMAAIGLDTEEAKLGRAFKELEDDAAAEAALKDLKAKLDRGSA